MIQIKTHHTLISNIIQHFNILMDILVHILFDILIHILIDILMYIKLRNKQQWGIIRTQTSMLITLILRTKEVKKAIDLILGAKEVNKFITLILRADKEVKEVITLNIRANKEGEKARNHSSARSNTGSEGKLCLILAGTIVRGKDSNVGRCSCWNHQIECRNRQIIAKQLCSYSTIEV